MSEVEVLRVLRGLLLTSMLCLSVVFARFAVTA